ncbi:MAG TPA: NAD(P)H-dependent oxidoreductase subunit E [Clostridia bacterium]|nr:NAD(P)H-dependent oxidoreductase subunit E [Clostridia bacterium]
MNILLNELQKVQDSNGYIPEEDIHRIARVKDISSTELYGIISFYSRFYLEPQPEYIIRVCKSITCSMNGSLDLSKELIKYLNIDNNISADGKFALEYVECLGQCNKAPVITINDEVHGELTKEKLLEILEDYRKEA